MREIKFRAWDKKGDGMFYNIQKGIVFDDQSKYEFDDFLQPKADDFHEWVVMQYTGLKDKNGKENFQGDITFTEDGEYSKTCEVCVYEEYLEFYLKDIYTGETFTLEEIGDFEILGNIYENPELLK